jgi:transposase
MAARLKVAAHLSVDQLYERYRRCEDAVEKTHWQVIWLKAHGATSGGVAGVTGYKSDWVRRLVHRYNEFGPDGIADRRAQNGRPPLLNERAQEELLSALAEPAPDGGLWNGVKVAKWIADRLGRSVPDKRGWVYLNRLGLSLQRPRPRNVEADELEQEAFKKNSATC